MLVALLFFGLGRYSKSNAPAEVRIEEPAIDLTQIYNKLNSLTPQLTESPSSVAGENTAKCEGKIKGNISSSSRIYHMPGGAFYNRTAPEMCFDKESEAQAAGFRKSQR